MDLIYLNSCKIIQISISFCVVLAYCIIFARHLFVPKNFKFIAIILSRYPFIILSYYCLILLLAFFFFLAALGLRCCARAFSGCASGGYSSLRCAGFSLRWLLLLQSTGSRRAGSVVVAHAPRHVGSSRTRDQSRVPCIGRQILNHCATREVLVILLMCAGYVLMSPFSFLIFII